MNASAGAANLLFVTTGALALDDERLEAILAHELGHHHGLHPVLTAVVWWLRIPGAVLGDFFAILRRLVGRIRLLVLLVTIWQATVMWLFWLGDLLAMRASRLSEFEADRYAARWGYGGQLARVAGGAGHRPPRPGSPAGCWPATRRSGSASSGCARSAVEQAGGAHHVALLPQVDRHQARHAVEDRRAQRARGRRSPARRSPGGRCSRAAASGPPSG